MGETRGVANWEALRKPKTAESNDAPEAAGRLSADSDRAAR
jgi:hypothetical protein